MSPSVLRGFTKASQRIPLVPSNDKSRQPPWGQHICFLTHLSFCSSSELPGGNASSLCWGIIMVLHHSLPIIIQTLPMDIFTSHQEICPDQPFTDFLSYLQQARKVAPGTSSSHSAASRNGLITRLPALPSQREHQLVYVSQRVWLNHPITVLCKALTEFLEGRGVSKGALSH